MNDTIQVNIDGKRYKASVLRYGIAHDEGEIKTIRLADEMEANMVKVNIESGDVDAQWVPISNIIRDSDNIDISLNLKPPKKRPINMQAPSNSQSDVNDTPSISSHYRQTANDESSSAFSTHKRKRPLHSYIDEKNNEDDNDDDDNDSDSDYDENEALREKTTSKLNKPPRPVRNRERSDNNEIMEISGQTSSFKFAENSSYNSTDSNSNTSNGNTSKSYSSNSFDSNNYDSFSLDKHSNCDKEELFDFDGSNISCASSLVELPSEASIGIADVTRGFSESVGFSRRSQGDGSPRTLEESSVSNMSVVNGSGIPSGPGHSTNRTYSVGGAASNMSGTPSTINNTIVSSANNNTNQESSNVSNDQVRTCVFKRFRRKFSHESQQLDNLNALPIRQSGNVRRQSQSMNNVFTTSPIGPQSLSNAHYTNEIKEDNGRFQEDSMIRSHDLNIPINLMASLSYLNSIVKINCNIPLCNRQQGYINFEEIPNLVARLTDLNQNVSLILCVANVLYSLSNYDQTKPEPFPSYQCIISNVGKYSGCKHTTNEEVYDYYNRAKKIVSNLRDDMIIGLAKVLGIVQVRFISDDPSFCSSPTNVPIFETLNIDYITTNSKKLANRELLNHTLAAFLTIPHPYNHFIPAENTDPSLLADQILFVSYVFFLWVVKLTRSDFDAQLKAENKPKDTELCSNFKNSTLDTFGGRSQSLQMWVASSFASILYRLINESTQSQIEKIPNSWRDWVRSSCDSSGDGITDLALVGKCKQSDIKDYIDIPNQALPVVMVVQMLDSNASNATSNPKSQLFARADIAAKHYGCKISDIIKSGLTHKPIETNPPDETKTIQASLYKSCPIIRCDNLSINPNLLA